ncbi:MAG: glucosaminidase domain-containing protein [Bacteroidota bacterium]
MLTFNACKNGQAEISESDTTTVKTLPEGHKDFIAKFYPGVVDANQEIMLQRAKILDLRNDYAHVVRRGIKIKWLNDLAEEYRFSDDFFNNSLSRSEYKSRIDSMLWRVDKIPAKLVIAQAIIESGWGKSGFARNYNNYFGIHCYTPGCGPAPSGVENPKFYVKSFPSIEDCVEEYLWLLNTGFAYEGLRRQRHELREEDRFPDALEMAKGLTRYSVKGSEYIEMVHTIINNYLPPNLEAFVALQQNRQQTSAGTPGV